MDGEHVLESYTAPGAKKEPSTSGDSTGSSRSELPVRLIRGVLNDSRDCGIKLKAAARGGAEGGRQSDG
jgi:hypothetical protein